MKNAAYKFRFYPDSEQASLLVRTFGCIRVVYNKILAERKFRYEESGESTSYNKASALLTALKREEGYEWLNDVSSVPLQQSLRHQQKAYTNFFNNLGRYPKFKHLKGKQSAEFTASAFKWDGEHLTLAKCRTPLDIRMHRQLPQGSEPKTVTISRNPDGRWYCAIAFEFEPEAMPRQKRAIGIDLGVTDTIVTSDGWKSGPATTEQEFAARICRANKNLARKTPGSKNWDKARQKLARLHSKATDKRIDRLHKLSHKIVSENQTICLEDLDVVGMLSSANRRLSAKLADASFGELKRQIEYKADWYGRTVFTANRFYPSSKTCNDCGFTVGKMPLDIRSWVCPDCESILDRDINAAKNILAAGLAVKDCGDDIRHLGAVVCETVNSDCEVGSCCL